MMRVMVFAVCWILLVCPSGVAISGISQPAPATDDLVLPGPDGTGFIFRPVYVNGETVFDGSSFIMGDAETDSFRTPPTRVVVGGAFEGDPDKGAWMFYMSKCEITRAQYRAVMGTLPGKAAAEPASSETDTLPVTEVSYFDAINFCDKLNNWLYANAQDKLPKAGPFPGFTRLPLETEWEYAARGGLAVQPSVLEAQTPYDDQLSIYEWFFGPKSSHGKIRPVGALKSNPLGLHDMLGNVQEITLSQYQVEYYQGRSGGFVSRGGHYQTPEDQMISAKRQEEPYYSLKGKTFSYNTKETMGFRMVLTAPLLTDREAISQFSDSWDAYRGGSGKSTPAALSLAPTSVQEDASVAEAMKRLDNLRSMETTDAVKNLNQQLANAQAELRKTVDIRRKADADAAQTNVEVGESFGAILAWYIPQRQTAMEYLQELQNSEEPDSKRIATIGKRLSQHNATVNDVVNKYRLIVHSLKTLPPDLVTKALAERKIHRQRAIQALSAATSTPNEAEQANAEPHGSSIATEMRQLQVLGLLQGHYEVLAQKHQGDTKGWLADFEAEFAPEPQESSEVQQ